MSTNLKEKGLLLQTHVNRFEGGSGGFFFTCSGQYNVFFFSCFRCTAWNEDCAFQQFASKKCVDFCHLAVHFACFVRSTRDIMDPVEVKGKKSVSMVGSTIFVSLGQEQFEGFVFIPETLRFWTTREIYENLIVSSIHVSRNLGLNGKQSEFFCQ